MTQREEAQKWAKEWSVSPECARSRMRRARGESTKTKKDPTSPYYSKLADYAKQRKVMQNVCAICGVKAQALDHDHKTDLIRGVLCNSCNWGLGHFKDNPELLYRACKYIFGHNKKGATAQTA